MIRIGIEIGTGESRHFRFKNSFYCRLYLEQKGTGGFLFIKNGVLAQLGERLFCKQKAAGSKPVRSTYTDLTRVGRVLPLQGRSWEFDPLSRYWTISITDRILRYERRGIGSTPIWSTQKQKLLFNNYIEWEKTGTSLTHLWVSYNG